MLLERPIDYTNLIRHFYWRVHHAFCHEPHLPTFIQHHVRIREFILTLVHPLLAISGFLWVLDWSSHRLQRLHFRDSHLRHRRKIFCAIYAIWWGLFFFVLVGVVRLMMGDRIRVKAVWLELLFRLKKLGTRAFLDPVQAWRCSTIRIAALTFFL